MKNNKHRHLNILVSAFLATSLMLCSCGKSAQTPSEPATQETKEGTGESVTASLFSKMESNSQEAYEKRQELARQTLTPCWTDTGKYRTAFDLKQYYSDESEFMADAEKLHEWTESLKNFEGTLTDAANIRKYYDTILDESMNEIFDRMLLYVELGKSLDVTDEYYKRLSDKVDEISEEYSHAVAFASPEIMEIEYEERVKIFEDPIFDDMTYYLSYFTNAGSKNHSKEARNEAADLTSLEGKGAEAYFEYRGSKYEPLDFEYAPGRSVPLNDDNYATILYSNQTREFKIAANKIYTDGYLAKGDDFLSFLTSSMELELKKSRIYGYDSVLQYESETSGISSDVFDGVIKSANNSIKDYQRYLLLHGKAIGADEQYILDMATKTSQADVPVMSFDDAVDMIGNAVAVLGDDYLDYYKEIVGNTNIDAVLGDNRESGSYTMAAGTAARPHIFTNYYGSYSDISALAHEIGHAINYCYSIDSQPQHYAEVSIFDTEVCSVMNEFLLNAYLVSNSSDDEEKLYYIERLLDIYSDMFFVQCMYSELEDYLYKELEAGRTLISENITDKLEELHVKYRGDSVNTQGLCWMTIDHLHYGYYMYKYATAICYASSIAQDILAGNAQAIDDYKEFMSAGSSDNPERLLLIAGINPESASTYEDANEYYRNLVDEYEKLLLSTGKIANE